MISLLAPEDHQAGHPRLGSAGRVSFGWEVRIVDPDGRDLGFDTAGELLIRGEPPCVEEVGGGPEASGEKIGLSIASHSGLPLARIGELAGAAEQAGFSAVFVAEGHGDALALCHPVAAATRRVRVGTAIANAEYRAAGVDLPVVFPMPVGDDWGYERTIAAMAR